MSFFDSMKTFGRGLMGSSARQSLNLEDQDQLKGHFGVSPSVNSAMAPQNVDPGELSRPPVAAQPQQRDPQRLGWRERAAIFATGLDDPGAAAKMRYGIENAHKNEALIAQAEKLGLSPREMLLLRLNPEQGAALLKERWSPYTLAEGGLRGQDGETVQYNPKIGLAEDTFYSQTPDGVELQGRRPVSFKEQSEADKRTADALRDKDRIGIAEGQLAIGRGQLGVAQGHLGLARDKDRRTASGGGGGSDPGSMSTDELLRALRGH